MHEHAPDGVEGDREEVVRQQERFRCESREERDGPSQSLSAELEVLEASLTQDGEVLV